MFWVRNVDSEWGNFELFGRIYWLYLRKFELFGARLLKKRGNGVCKKDTGELKLDQELQQGF